MTRERLRLLALIVAPPVFLFLVSLGRTNRDLSSVFFGGWPVLFVIGLATAVTGFHDRRWERVAGAAIAILSLLITGFYASMTALWIGGSEKDVTVVIRDAESDEPVSNARVHLSRYANDKGSEETTDDTGTAVLHHRFWATGASSPLRKTGTLQYWEDMLSIDATGYESIHEPLTIRISRPWDLYGPPPPPVEVLLKRRAMVGQ